MANEMPNPSDYSGLSRKVLEYCNAFNALVPKIAKGAAKGAALMGLGLGLLVVALLVLIAFLVLGLGALLDDRYWLSALIVGGILAVLGLIAVLVGRRGMSEQALKPQRTIATLRDNTDWARAEAREIRRELTGSDEEE